MAPHLKKARLYLDSCFRILLASDKKVLDLSQKLQEKKQKEEQEKLKRDLEAIKPAIEEPGRTIDDLSKKREQKFLSEVEEKAGIWMHRFSDVRKDDSGFFILKSDNPAGYKIRIGDELSDYALNMTPYWRVESIKDQRISLIPINNNPFKTGTGAGGAKITKHDIDVYTGDYERKKIEQVNEAIEKGNIDIDSLKYLLLGTIPVQFGPNGAQGGWYNVNDTYSNRGGRQGLKPKDIMVADAKTIKEYGLPVPIKALDGTMAPYDWDQWISGSGSEDHYFPKDVDKYVDFAKQMTQKGKWRYDEDSIQEMYRKFDPQKLEDYFEQMLKDVAGLSDEEWQKKYPYRDKNVAGVLAAYEFAKQKHEKAKAVGKEYFTEVETDELKSVLENVFSKERRVANRNVLQLIEMAKENPDYIKYLHDIIKIGGAPDYLTNEHIIKFFDLIDDIDGLKLAALHLKDSDNIRYALSYLIGQGEKKFVINKLENYSNNLEVLNGVLGRLSSDYRDSELRKNTFGRNDELLNFIKKNNVLQKIKDAVASGNVVSKHYAGELSALILNSFGPNMLWAPEDEELVRELKVLRQ